MGIKLYSGYKGGIPLVSFCTMAVYGKIEEFEPDKESNSAYLERVQLFFDANDIATVEECVSSGKSYEFLFTSSL